MEALPSRRRRDASGKASRGFPRLWIQVQARVSLIARRTFRGMAALPGGCWRSREAKGPLRVRGLCYRRFAEGGARRRKLLESNLATRPRANLCPGCVLLRGGGTIWPFLRTWSLAGSERCQERCFGGALLRFPRTSVPDTSFFIRAFLH